MKYLNISHKEAETDNKKSQEGFLSSWWFCFRCCSGVCLIAAAQAVHPEGEDSLLMWTPLSFTHYSTQGSLIS